MLELAVVPPNPLMIAGPSPKVLDPTTTFVAEVPRLIGVPDTVIAGAPGTSVWLPMTTFPAEFVGRPAMLAVLLPTTIRVPDGPSEIAVPATVTAGPPGTRVCEPIAIAPEGAALTVVVRTVAGN